MYNAKIKKQPSYFSRIRSRHPSHDQFRMLFKFNFKSVIRFGSTTLEDVPYELNSVESVKKSSNKRLMKECFNQAEVNTADWWTAENTETFLFKAVDGIETRIPLADLPYPIVAKHIHGSRGTGNILLNNQEELEAWLVNKNLNNYIFEKFYNYSREYRLHVSKAGCFYTCRKMLRSDVPEADRWYRNDSNSVWMLESNELFDRPVNWSEIERQCVLAMESVELDFAAIDLRIQSAKDRHGELRENPEFIILETNSAPSMGDITAIKYKENIPLIFKNKYS